MKRKLFAAFGVIMALILLIAGGVWYYVQSGAYMQEAAKTVSSLATDKLGVPVTMGDIKVNSLHDLEINNIELYDKQAETIATVDRAVVSFRLLSVLSDNPVDAVKEVELSGVNALLSQRDDGTWNVQDLISDNSSSQEFHGLIKIDDANVTGRMQGKELTLSEVAGSVDFADYPVMKVDVKAVNQGADIEATGSVSSDRQIINATVKGVDIMNYMDLVPDGTIPDTVTIEGGKIDSVDLHVYRNDGILSYTGEADFSDGAFTVMQTDVDDVKGHAAFSNRDVLISVDAEANEQKAHANGKILLDTGMPYLDITATSDAFDPSKVMTDIPYQGAVAFTAKIKGPVDDPLIDAHGEVAEGSVSDIPFQNASADVRYEDSKIYVKNLNVDAFGGHVSGEAAVDASSLKYTAHAKVQGVDLTALAPYVPNFPDVTGKVSADIGASGTSNDINTIEAYGSANVYEGSFQNIPIQSLSTSFYFADDNLIVDYLSARLPNNTTMGIEGSIEAITSDAPRLDINYYGGHVDLSLLQNLDSRLDMTGLADFKGTVHGDATNPQVEIKFSGLFGTVFKQPFDSLLLEASGSLDQITINDFLMEKNGKETWRAKGYVGLSGEKKIDLQLDTMGARMEDLAALVAPDEPITGNVDNIIKFTGTLDNPQAVGYVHFYQGSYRGVLLSGMDGDYFLEDGVVRLQDFHAFSPMIDMVLNGTIDKTGKLNMKVAANDIDLKRVEHKLPYEVDGHGKFDGYILGTTSAPEFYGLLEAPQITLNGQNITNLRGMVKYKDNIISVDQFGFEQNEGTYDMILSINTDTMGLDGNVVVQNADINAICAILNLKNDVVQGRLSSGIELKGTKDHPIAHAEGTIAQGTIGGYDVHDVALNVDVNDQLVTINKLSGAQGETGAFDASGTITIGGPIDAKLTATNLALGMFTKAGGVTADVTGTADVTATFSGTTDSPAAEVQLNAVNGGIQGSTFDTLTGTYHLRNGLITVDDTSVTKAVGDKTYSASAKGIVPLKALTAQPDEWVDQQDQIQLNIDLNNADLSILPLLSKHVDWALGATQGNIRIGGTLSHPMILGTLSIPDAAVKIKELELPFTNMNTQIVFAGNQVTLKEFSGKMGDGTYSGKGTLEMEGLTPNHYDLTLTADNLDIRSDFFKGPLNANFHIYDTDFYGRHWPKIEGTVNFENCTVSMPTIPDSDGALPDMVFDITVNVGDNVHAYSSYLYDLYLTGGFHVGGITSHPNMSGSIQTMKGGTISYLKTRFNVRRGIITFNQIGSFMPSVDFFADTKLSQTRVFIAVNGPLGSDDMKVVLTSSPQLSQTQILKILTLKTSANPNAALDASDILSAGLQMAFLSEVEDFARNYLDLDEFNISSGNGALFTNRRSSQSSENDPDKYDFNVEMGKYIGKDIMVKYTHGFGSNQLNRYGVIYDVSNNFGVALMREDNNYIVGFQAQKSF